MGRSILVVELVNGTDGSHQQRASKRISESYAKIAKTQSLLL